MTFGLVGNGIDSSKPLDEDEVSTPPSLLILPSSSLLSASVNGSHAATTAHKTKHDGLFMAKTGNLALHR